MAWGPIRLSAMERAALLDAADRYAEQMRLSVNAGVNRAEKAQAVSEGFINAVENILSETEEFPLEQEVKSQFKTPE